MQYSGKSNWRRRSRAALALSTAGVVALAGLAGTHANADEANHGVVMSTDFSEHPVGKGVPDGWTELFASSFYEIADNPSRLVKTSIGDNRHLLAWEDIGEVEGDVEVATLLRQPETTRPELPTTRVSSWMWRRNAAGMRKAWMSRTMPSPMCGSASAIRRMSAA